MESVKIADYIFFMLRMASGFFFWCCGETLSGHYLVGFMGLALEDHAQFQV